MTELVEPAEPLPPAAPPPAGWEGILAPGERILWQGPAGGGVVWADLLDTRTAFGLFFAGFAVFWVAMASSMGGPSGMFGGLFPLFGLPFIAVGLYMAGGRLFWEAWQRGRTHYTLTDRTAFVATSLFGQRKLARYPLAPGMTVELDDGEPGTVWFAKEVTHHAGGWRGTGDNRRYRGPYSTTRRIGFERIAEARRVYRLLLDASARLAAPEGAAAGDGRSRPATL